MKENQKVWMKPAPHLHHLLCIKVTVELPKDLPTGKLWLDLLQDELRLLQESQPHPRLQ